MKRNGEHRQKRLGPAVGLCFFALSGILSPGAAAAPVSNGSRWITRDDINAGGMVAEINGGTGQRLSGSVGFIENGITTNGTRKLAGGLQAQLYYPDNVPTPLTVADLQYDITATTVKLSWTQPAMHHDDLSVKVGRYDVRQMEKPALTSVMNESEFNSATPVLSGVPTPDAIATSTGMVVTGLSYNRFYAVGVRALELPAASNDPDSESFRISTITICTLPNTPSVDSVKTVGTFIKKLEVIFVPANPDLHTLDFQVELNEDPTFSAGTANLKLVSNYNSNSNKSVLFEGLKSRTIYFARVQSRGRSGLWTAWSPSKNSGGVVLTPTLTLNSVNVNEVKVQVVNPYGDASSKVEYSETPFPYNWQQGSALRPDDNYVETLTLANNTTYYLRAVTYVDEGSGPVFLSSSTPAVSLVTGVLNPAPTIPPLNIYSTSVTFNWSFPLANGSGIAKANTYSYGFQISSTSWASISDSSRVFYPGNTQVGIHSFTGLTANALYGSSVTAFNRMGINQYSEVPSKTLYGDFITLPNKPSAPVFLPAANPTREIHAQWASNGNSAGTKYRVELHDSGGLVFTDDVVANDFLFQAPIHDIKANQAYFVKVQALPVVISGYVTAGPSAFAVSATTATAPLAVPFTSVTPGNFNINVSWTDQVSGFINHPNTEYELKCNGVPPTLVVKTTPTLTYNINSGLTHNTTYTLELKTKPHSAGGWSPAITMIQRVTLANTPKAELGYTPGTDTLLIPWSAEGNPVGTRYLCQISTDSGFPATAVTLSSDTRNPSATFSSLIPNTEYWYRVKAINHEDVSTIFTLLKSAYTKPRVPLIQPYGKPDEFTLVLNWDRQGNAPETDYQVRLDGAAYGPLLPNADQSSFPPFEPDTVHSFQIKAKYRAGAAGDAETAVSTACTLAERPAPATVRNFVGQTAIAVNVYRGKNRALTEYAFEMLDKDDNSLGYMENYVSGSNKAMRLRVAPAPLWKPLAVWATESTDAADPSGTYFVLVEGLSNDPNNVPKLKVLVRNQQLEETLPSDPLDLVFPSGPPLVRLTTWSGVFTATESVATDVFYSTDALDGSISFEAEGSGHFNIFLSSIVQTLVPPMVDPTQYASRPGWNGGLGNGAAPCWNDPSVEFYSNIALRFCTDRQEGEYYLHIVGDRLKNNLGVFSVDTPLPIENFPVSDQTYFRVKLDLTAPDAGLLKAVSDGYLITNNNSAPLGFQTIDFSWSDFVDGGHPSSKSPIVGWSYSFSTNAGDTPPQTNTGSNFLPHSATPMKKINLGDPATLPETETYYFQVVGLDRAGNWQGTPSVFVYHFKKDVVPPHFVEATLSGTRLPKGSTPLDFHFAAVDPTQPIRLIFSEEVNLDAPGSLSFIQTHDALGGQSSTAIAYTVSTAPVPGSPDTQMNVSAALIPGARYEIVSSTSLLRDLGGNRLPEEEKFTVVFFTLLNPAVLTVISSGDPGEEFRLEIAAGAVGVGPSGISFDDEVQSDPHSVGNVVRKASGAMSRRSGGVYNQVLASKEFNHYKPDGTQLKGTFDGKVRLVFPYASLAPDADGVCQNVPGGRPVLETKLAIYQLDELSGSWMKMPGSRVDTAAKEVSVDLQHFSVYALIGAASFDLTDAHPYPVPYKAAEHPAGITFVFPNADLATVKVYTLDGRLVKTLSDTMSTGFVRWNPVTNDDGDPVASDVYLYVIENDQERRVGKLMVIR